MASFTGWLATACVVIAALLPLGFRIQNRRRAAPTSRLIRAHVVLGMVTSAAAFLHTIAVLPALGSPAATGGGALALLPGGFAFFLLMAHVGVGLQLRKERLPDRPAKRRTHAMLALSIATTVAMHAGLLLRAG